MTMMMMLTVFTTGDYVTLFITEIEENKLFCWMSLINGNERENEVKFDLPAPY